MLLPLKMLQCFFNFGFQLAYDVHERCCVVAFRLHYIAQGYLDKRHIENLLLILGPFVSGGISIDRLRDKACRVAIERLVLRSHVYGYVRIVDV